MGMLSRAIKLIAHITFLCFLLTAVSYEAAQALDDIPLTLVETIGMRELQDRPLDNNVLKLFRAVADPVRNRVYVSGILTQHLAVMDGATEEWIGTIDTGIQGNSYKYLSIDTTANRLYVYDGVNNTLMAINIGNGTKVGPVVVPSMLGAYVPDHKRGYLYITSSEKPGFRALDGTTLQEVYSVSEVGETVTKLALDETTDTIYLLDTPKDGTASKIHVIDPMKKTLANTITLKGSRSTFFSWDQAGKRFFTIAGHSVSILDAQGTEQRSITLPSELDIEDMLYDAGRSSLIVLMVEQAGEGMVSGVNGHLLVYNPDTGQLLSELAFGKKVHSLALNAATGRVYLPNGDASVVWSVASDRKSVISLRLGDSLEQVVPALNGRLLCMNSRLGGSYLMTYDVESGTFETFTSGTWPIPLRTDSSGSQLFVLNAWDSTLSVFSLTPGRTLLGTVPLGIPIGSTDRLPDLAIDSTNKRAYAAYPEFAKIIVFDLEAMKTITNIPVSGFPEGDQGGGPGGLQVMVNEDSGKLFVLRSSENLLELYDAAGSFNPLKQTSLSGTLASGANSNLMFLDRGLNRLFVGAVEIDAATGALTGRRLPYSARVFGLDEQKNFYWANAVNDSMETIIVFDRQTLAERARFTLGSADSLYPDFALDTKHSHIYVGRMITAKFDIYTTAKMELPSGASTYSYASSADPAAESNPVYARPFGVGNLDAGTLGLKVSFAPFASEVDIYLAFSLSSDVSTGLWLVGSDNSVQPYSGTLVKWKSGVTASINETLFGDIPAANLPKGDYYLYAAVTPKGNTGTYYLWSTYFKIE